MNAYLWAALAVAGWTLALVAIIALGRAAARQPPESDR
jgi:hypothetical protein